MTNPAKKTQKIPTVFQDKAPLQNQNGFREEPVVAAVCHTGFCRNNNEDCYGFHVSPDHRVRLLAVADGIGGHGNGDRASKLVIRELLSFWRKICDTSAPDQEDDIIGQLQRELVRINNKIHAINIAAGIKVPMGATLALLLLQRGKAVTFHAGDSRIYRLRANELTPLTEDHSYISEFLKNGTLTKDKASEHPLAHVILRSLGPVANAEVEVNIYDLESKDRFLVCSDGLTAHLTDDEIRKIMLDAPSSSAIAKDLLQQTFRNGAHDNVTILCTEYV